MSAEHLPDAARTVSTKKRWQFLTRIVKWAAATSLVIFATLGVAIGIVYASFDLPEMPATQQATIVYYADGKTEIARFAKENREDVTLNRVPLAVRQTVLAAEDRDFYHHPGVSFEGIARAALGLVTGKNRGGGSTITQQYVRNALDLTREPSITRKVKEIVLAIKLDDRYSKNEILQRYLNIIYFGRGAWGIQAASQAYFDKPAEQLTVAEGALLAATIKDPTNFDPANDPTGARHRWNYIIDRMVQQRWLGVTDAAALTYPQSVSKYMDQNAWKTGPNGLLAYQVEQELQRQGFSQEELYTGGLRVVTTINPTLQGAVIATIRRNMTTASPRLASATVITEAETDRVLAYYGGERNYGQFDFAASTHLIPTQFLHSVTIRPYPSSALTFEASHQPTINAAFTSPTNLATKMSLAPSGQALHTEVWVGIQNVEVSHGNDETPINEEEVKRLIEEELSRLHRPSPKVCSVTG